MHNIFLPTLFSVITFERIEERKKPTCIQIHIWKVKEDNKKKIKPKDKKKNNLHTYTYQYEMYVKLTFMR